jgi:hypothetical protein
MKFTLPGGSGGGSRPPPPPIPPPAPVEDTRPKKKTDAAKRAGARGTLNAGYLGDKEVNVKQKTLG